MSEQASEMEDATELDQFNKKLENKNAYLLVRKDGTIVYTGSDDDRDGRQVGLLCGDRGQTSPGQPVSLLHQEIQDGDNQGNGQKGEGQ